MILDGQATTLKRMTYGNMNESSLRVLAVSSGKGGVGKTNIVANLSYALSKRGKKVLVVDADLEADVLAAAAAAADAALEAADAAVAVVDADAAGINTTTKKGRVKPPLLLLRR